MNLAKDSIRKKLSNFLLLKLKFSFLENLLDYFYNLNKIKWLLFGFLIFLN